MRCISIFAFSAIITLSLNLFSLGLCFSAYWHYFLLDNCWYGETALKLDSLELPYILYDKYSGLQLAHYTGIEWEYETIYGTVPGGDFSLALDAQDRPHISYFGWYPDDLMYCYWDGNDWVIEFVDDEDESGLWNSIALDSYGNPHIAYEHSIYKGESDLRYAYRDEGGWQIEVVDDEYQFQGSFCSLALDSQGYAQISYGKGQSGISYLAYAHWDGFQWQIENVDSFTAHTIDATSIVVDSQDRPHIAYMDGWVLYYAHWSGTDWLIDELDDCNGLLSIALDSQEYPHIAYSHDNIKYASWNGSEWVIEFACDEELALGQFGVSLDMDSEDNPHISCDEFYYGEIYYVWFGDPLTDITLDHFSAHAEGSGISLNWSVYTTEGDQITGFNLYRRELWLEDGVVGGGVRADGHPPLQGVNTTWTKVNPNLITGENPYSYTDSDVEAGVAYEYKLEAVLADDSPVTLGTTQATAGKPTSFAILALYPNPASDYLACLLALPSPDVVELRLYDISGRLVLKQQLEPTEPAELEAILDVSGLASGVYTLRASSGGAEASARAVVVR